MHRLLYSLVFCAMLLATTNLAQGQVSVAHPLERQVYQTNETIRLAVTRSAERDLAEGPLVVALKGEDGSQLSFEFRAPAVPAQNGQARATEHVNLSGKLLRPGKYNVHIEVDGQSAETDIELYSEVRKSSYRLINWGSRAKSPEQQLDQGQARYGYNLVMQTDPRQQHTAAWIRAGVDTTPICIAGGGHQMDLRHECDWSDPYVLQSIRRRAVNYATGARSNPTLVGIHMYDEPGLTWMKHEKTGEFTPHMIPAQVRAFESAFGKTPLDYSDVDPSNPDHVEAWSHWATWKLSFMEAAWKDAQFGVDRVDPSLMTLTQSQYGWPAFTDGYYFNIQRQLPITMGHGGYDDLSLGYLQPSFTLEASLARETNQVWYMPLWYTNSGTKPGLIRLEQYLSFQTGIAGMATPPPLDPTTREEGRAEITETNRLMGRLGTPFPRMDAEPAPIAVLYSMSHNIDLQTREMGYMYGHGDDHVENMYFAYLALKQLQMPFEFVVDEDVVDGSVAAERKAVLLISVDHLSASVRNGLEQFIANGGVVLATADSGVEVKGATNLGVTPSLPSKEQLDAVRSKIGQASGEERKALLDEMRELNALRNWIKGSEALIQPLKSQFAKAGIEPILGSSEPGVSATRVAEGDIEYIMAVNAAHDFEAEDSHHGIKAITADITLPADGRPVYDVTAENKATPFTTKSGQLAAKVAFDKGDIKIYARTARPIGGVAVGTPVVRRELTNHDLPIRLEISGMLLDDKGKPLSAAVPLRVRVTDPAGRDRFDLHRATDSTGSLHLTLPLAANDPRGQWAVDVEEYIAKTSSETHFTYDPAPQCGALAGLERRALFLNNDRENVYRFFRDHKQVTVVKGAADYHQAAAERLARILKPYDVDVEIVEAESVNKARHISEEAATSWGGITHTGRGSIKPGSDNPIHQAGFALDGPTILLGSPADNPLIAFLQKYHTLPVDLSDDVPGVGRGLVTWNLDTLGSAIETVVLLANDQAGLEQAIGSMYEAQAGLHSHTRWELPVTNTVKPADAKSMATAD